MSPQGSAVGAALRGHVVLGHLPSIDEAAALVQVTDVVHPDPNTAEVYRRLRPGFAATAEAIEQAQLWRLERTPTDRVREEGCGRSVTQSFVVLQSACGDRCDEELGELVLRGPRSTLCCWPRWSRPARIGLRRAPPRHPPR